MVQVDGNGNTCGRPESECSALGPYERAPDAADRWWVCTPPTTSGGWTLGPRTLLLPVKWWCHGDLLASARAPQIVNGPVVSPLSERGGKMVKKLSETWYIHGQPTNKLASYMTT